MADTRTPVRGRIKLRTSAHNSPALYARAFALRVARRMAARAAALRVARRVARSMAVTEYSADAEAKCLARLAPAAEFVGAVINSIPVGSHPHAALVSPLHDGSLDQALQALRAADPRQAVKMLSVAMEQAGDIAESGEARRIEDAIRVTCLIMANPDRLPALRTVGAPAMSRVSPEALAALLADFNPQHFPDLQVQQAAKKGGAA